MSEKKYYLKKLFHCKNGEIIHKYYWKDACFIISHENGFPIVLEESQPEINH